MTQITSILVLTFNTYFEFLFVLFCTCCELSNVQRKKSQIITLNLEVLHICKIIFHELVLLSLLIESYFRQSHLHIIMLLSSILPRILLCSFPDSLTLIYIRTYMTMPYIYTIINVCVCVCVCRMNESPTMSRLDEAACSK